MKFRIHYTVDDHVDSFEVEGEDIMEIRQEAQAYFESRGLDQDDCSPWSEEI